MEEKNKLVTQMEVSKNGGSVKTIIKLVKKYCPEIELDEDFLNSFSMSLSNLFASLCADERTFDRVSDLFPPNFEEQDRLRDSMQEATSKIKEKAGSPEIIDAMSKAKYALSVIVYKASDQSFRISQLDTQLSDIRESLRLDEEDVTSDERLDEEARVTHPTYSKLASQLEDANKLCVMFDRDRSLLYAAITMYENESTLYHNSYDFRDSYEYWPEYKNAITERLKQMEDMQKGGKK